jgi:hypothetical protein
VQSGGGGAQSGTLRVRERAPQEVDLGIDRFDLTEIHGSWLLSGAQHVRNISGRSESFVALRHTIVEWTVHGYLD